jgi:hypothetical protein
MGDAVAVVFANGAIMDGNETPGNVGVILPRRRSAMRVWIRK